MNDYSRKKLSVIIPVYNEERTIKVLLEKVAAVQLPFKKEIIIVNDGSKDASAEIIKQFIADNTSAKNEFKFFEKSNGGKGSAVKHGIAESTGDVLIIQDADLEYDPNDYMTCVRPILDGECKVVYGSREASNRNRIYSAPSFYLGGLSLTLWMNLLFGTELSDEPTCYKTFDGNLIRSVPIEGNKFDWEPEISAKLARFGFEILEVPISYYPRSIEQGKKIKWNDGLESFLVALKWRFMPLRKERESVIAGGGEIAKTVRNSKRAFNAFLLVIGIAMLIRLLFALPGIINPELLMRPDSSSYIQPALSMLQDWAFNTTPGSGEPALIRTPGYPLFLAILLKISGGSLSFCAAFSALFGALLCVPVFLCGHFFGGWKVGFIASLLVALNPTAIALSPMFLSDSLFSVIIAFNLYFALRHLKTGGLPHAMILGVGTGLAALIRPLNMYWLLPGVVLIILSRLPLRRKVSGTLALLLLTGVCVTPWIMRNAANDGGYRIDLISGEVYFFNAPVLISKMTGEPPSEIRNRLAREVQEEFDRHPDLYVTPAQKAAYKESLLFNLVKEHPFRYASLHIPFKTLLPDIPSLVENIGLSKAGKGTFDVLVSKGTLAAAKHYFNGRWEFFAIALPMLAIWLVIYLCAFIFVIAALFRLNIQTLVLVGAFVLFYLVIPGPVTMPRYQLPALPLISLMAAWTIIQIKDFKWNRLSSQTINE